MRSAEVIIVGGGVCGTAVAYELALRSVDVLLLDHTLPGRASSASAGGLWPIGEAIGLGCGVIHHSSGAASGNVADTPILPDVFREFLSKSCQQFPALASRLLEESGIDIEYDEGPGLLFLCYEENERKFAEQLRDRLPSSSRFDMLPADEVRKIEPQVTDKLLGAALLKGEHQVNPMLLAEGFKRAAISHGARFQAEARATKLCREGNRVVGVQTADELLSCDTVVNAAGAWAGNLAATAELELPVFPVRGQIVLTQALPRTLNACLSTTGCYLAQKRHGEVMVGSTTEEVGFDVSVTPEGITGLCRAAVRAVPSLRIVGLKRIWSGLRPGSPDELPILGPVQGISGYENASGLFRTGIVAAPLTGRLVAQLVVGEVPEFPIEPFLVDRFCRPAMSET